MIRPLILAIAALTLTGTAHAAPRRIVSLNVCADQYLIALADKGQIAALSSNALFALRLLLAKLDHFLAYAAEVVHLLAYRADLLQQKRLTI